MAKILVIGDLILDVGLPVTTKGFCQESDHSPRFIPNGTPTITAGGVGNVSLSLQNLGHDVLTITFLGENARKYRCSDRNTLNGHILMTDKSSVKTRYYSSDGLVFRVDDDHQIPPRDNELANLEVAINDSLASQYDALVLVDYRKGTIDLAVDNILKQALKRYWPPVMFYGGSIRRWHCMRQIETSAEVVTVGNGRSLTGGNLPQPGSLTQIINIEASQTLFIASKMQTHVLTVGAKGSFGGVTRPPVYELLHSYICEPAKVREIADPCGAGDAYLAGFIDTYLAERQAADWPDTPWLSHCMRAADRCGYACTGRRGAAIVQPADLKG
jgi:bifunctional ADP-heptose synthase (sugar kinase/adenylyltransferase)